MASMPSQLASVAKPTSEIIGRAKLVAATGAGRAGWRWTACRAEQAWRRPVALAQKCSKKRGGSRDAGLVEWDQPPSTRAGGRERGRTRVCVPRARVRAGRGPRARRAQSQPVHRASTTGWMPESPNGQAACRTDR